MGRAFSGTGRPNARTASPRVSALIYCPFPDGDSAEVIGGALLDEGLIACINILGPIQSLYVWNGERGEGAECAALLKTDAALLQRAVTRLEALHPYDSPAIMGWRCDAPGVATEEWLKQLPGA